MTTNAERLQVAVDYLQNNQASVDAHGGIAYAEQRIMNALAGVETTGRSLIGYAYQSLLLKGVPEVNDRNQAYLFTHMVFFATDFGRRPLEIANLQGYTDLLDSILPDYHQDLDVLGELLAVAKCLGYWSVACDVALAIFITGWDELDKVTFGNDYHTILVGGILFSML